MDTTNPTITTEPRRANAMTIQLRRKPACRFDHRPLEVVVDGCCVGTIATGQDKAIELDQGEHRVLVRVGSTSSQEFSVTCSHGHRLLLECGVKVPPPSFVMQFYLIRCAGVAVAMVGACVVPEAVGFLCRVIVMVQVVLVIAVAIRNLCNIRVSDPALYLRHIP
jgi:hypothetical protein